MEQKETMSLNLPLFALAAVVTREGRVRNLELLLQDSGRAPVGGQAIVDLLDAASQMRFEPARAGGAPAQLAQTLVRGLLEPPAVIARPRGAPRATTPQASIPVRSAAPAAA